MVIRLERVQLRAVSAGHSSLRVEERLKHTEKIDKTVSVGRKQWSCSNLQTELEDHY